ncbi:hypothetical protein [Staphylococcus caeli]
MKIIKALIAMVFSMFAFIFANVAVGCIWFAMLAIFSIFKDKDNKETE